LLTHVFLLILPVKTDFRVAWLPGGAVPVYFLFLYAPLKDYTRNVRKP
jgi:hypothetical protein